jgi:hypothetical protein
MGDHDTGAAMWRRSLTVLEELAHPDAKSVRAKLSR